MAGLWDSMLKRLVGANPEHFAKWLAPEATFVAARDIELKSQHTFADALLDIRIHEELAMLHLEFQTSKDPEMEVRLLEYNILASRQYEHCPVYSYTIYVRPVGELAESPYIRTFPNGEEVHRFHYRVIKLWEIPSEDLLQMEWMGLLPLLTLTGGGKQPEVVNRMIGRLAEAEEMDLLAISRIIGGLVFKTESEREWFRRRFHMFQDILKESWVYQEIGQEFLEQGFEKGMERGIEKGLEEGLKKGHEEERQRALQRLRQMLVSFVEIHFPDLTAEARQRIQVIHDPDILQNIFLKLVAAQQIDEARQIFEQEARS